MKKLSVLSTFFCLLLAAGAAFAQNKATNFAGNWELDVAKSKLPERMRVESMTMNVTQNNKELKVQTRVKRAAPPETSPMESGGGMRPDGNRGMVMRGGGGMGGGNSSMTYTLDGKETTVTPESRDGMPSTPIMLQAKMEKAGKLKLISSRSFDTPNGSMSIKTTETWEMSDGKTLKVTRDMETPRGTMSSEMYFRKKESASDSGKNTTQVYQGETVNAPADSISGMPKRISGGVLNGKALLLPKPGYPAEARAAKASGTVNVKIEIDEQGNVVSAQAISGDSLLRAASEESARNAKFAPTMLQGIPVKVTGIIVYNFVAP